MPETGIEGGKMPQATEAAEPNSVKVLVVDDSEANRALAKGALEDEGYQVILAAGGAEGVAAFEREGPDCVILDVRMPGVDGFMACAQIRALPHGPETPILFLTALRDVDTFDSALRAGGDDFLTKPIRPTELIVRVQTAIKLRRMSLELRKHFELLKHQRDDLLRLQLQKERLMAFVVHDLKNPVHAIDLLAQLLVRSKEMSGASREHASSIRDEARSLNRMILNLLDIAKADEGRLAVRAEELSLHAMVEEVLAELTAHADAHEVGLRSKLETDRIRADEDLVRRTLTNLVENAIRYAPSQSSVTVSAARVSGEVELRVADAGKGIPLALSEKVFDPFVQVEETGGMRRGRGLGLAFCKLAAAAHGGRIWVEDAAPGAIFCVRLPHA